MAKKILQWLMVGVAFVVLTACGGGGGNGVEKNTTQQNTPQPTQNKKTITGYVIDDPVVGATIEVYDANGTLLTKEDNATDSSGKFSVSIDENTTYPVVLKITKGLMNNSNFNSTMYSLCYQSKCNVTPVTTISTLSFMKSLSTISENDISKYMQDTLGVSEWQNVNLTANKNISKYIKDNNQSLDYVVSILASDINDGYIDDDITKTIFPNGNIRKEVNNQFDINTSVLNNIENRNIVLKNLKTAEEVGINDSISYKDFALEIAVVEKYTIPSFTGGNTTTERVLLLPFSIYNKNKIDIYSTLYNYLFLDPTLNSFNNEQKKALIKLIPTKYKDNFDELVILYQKYINYGDIYKDSFLSTLDYLQTIIKKDLKTTPSILQNSQNENIARSLYGKSYRSISTSSVKNYIDFGGISLTYNPKLNKFIFKNMIPKYYGLTTKSDFNNFVQNYNQGISLKGIVDSLNHNLVSENPAGLAGLGISAIFSIANGRSVGGEKTKMLCEEFDGSICTQDYLTTNYSQSYILYSNLNASSLQGVLNGLDIAKSILPAIGTLKVEAIQEIVRVAKKTDKKVKEAIDKLEYLDMYLDIAINIFDILEHNKEELSKYYINLNNQETINQLKNLKGNIASILSSFNDLFEYLQLGIPNDEQKKELRNSISAESLLKSVFGADVISFNDAVFNKLPIIDTNKIKFKFIDNPKKVNLNVWVTTMLITLAIDDSRFTKEIKYKKNLVKINGSKFSQIRLGYQFFLLWDAWGINDTNGKNEIKNYLDRLIRKGIIETDFKLKRDKDYFRAIDNIKDNYFIKSLKLIDLSSINFRKNYNKFINQLIIKAANTLKLAKFVTQQVNNINYSHLSMKETLDFVVNYIVIPLYYKGMENTEGAIKERIVTALATFNPVTKGIYFANEAGGKIVAMTMFPNKITFKATVLGQNDIDFSSSIDGITPIGFDKGIVLPWGKDSYMQDAFLKRPTNDSFYGLIVADSQYPTWYRPYFNTFFKEKPNEIENKLDDFDEQIFAKIDWKYKSCPDDIIKGKFELINTVLCQDFNYEKIFTVTGNNIDNDKFGINDKFILPYKGHSYMDFFDIIAVATSDKWWDNNKLKNSTVRIKNDTRGIYLDQLQAKYYAFNDSIDSKFDSPKSTDLLFKIASSNDFNFKIEEQKDRLTISNMCTHEDLAQDIDLTFLILDSEDFAKNKIPAYYSFDVDCTFDESNNKKEILKSNLAGVGFGNNITIIAVDKILKSYSKYIGDDNIMRTIYSLKPKKLTYEEYFNKYSNLPSKVNSYYPFMKIKRLKLGEIKKPVIDFISLSSSETEGNPFKKVDTPKVYLKAKIHDDDEDDSLTCSIDYGDGSEIKIFACDNAITDNHTYPSEGVYIVTLEIKDSYGLSNSIEVGVEIVKECSDNSPDGVIEDGDATNIDQEGHTLGSGEESTSTVTGGTIIDQGNSGIQIIDDDSSLNSGNCKYIIYGESISHGELGGGGFEPKDPPVGEGGNSERDGGDNETVDF